MRIKNKLIKIFICLAPLGFVFIEPNKSEENICYYSNLKQHLKCTKRDKTLIKPKYPFFNDDLTWTDSSKNIGFSNSNWGSIYEMLELRSTRGKEIEVIIGDKSVGINGANPPRPFITERNFSINSDDVISWASNDNSFYRTYEIKYLDNIGESRSLKFTKFKNARGEFLGPFFKDITKLNYAEERQIELILNRKLLNNKKKLDIIRSVIKVQNSSTKECIEVNKYNYPDLVENYKNLFQTINPLRAKLNMAPSNTIKPICN